MSAYTSEIAAKFHIQRAFSFYNSARMLMREANRFEPAALLAYEAILDGAKALLFAEGENADGCDAVLLALAKAVENGKVTPETQSIIHEAAQIHFKIHRRGLIVLRPQETEALISNTRTLLREVRDHLEQKFGLIEGL